MEKQSGLLLREQPVYRVSDNPGECTITELLAAMIRGKKQRAIAEQVMTEYGERLPTVRPGDLQAIHGLRKESAAALLAAIELGKRLAGWELGERPVINSPAAVGQLVVQEMSAFQEEHLWVVILNTRNRLIKIVDLYKGSIHTVSIRTGEVFREAVQHNAAGIILIHNHPSGCESVSPEDIALTRQIVEAGRLMEIPVLDHLIIGGGRWISLRERGLGFDRHEPGELAGIIQNRKEKPNGVQGVQNGERRKNPRKNGVHALPAAQMPPLPASDPAHSVHA